MKTLSKIIAIAFLAIMAVEISHTAKNPSYIPWYFAGATGVWVASVSAMTVLTLWLFPHRAELTSIIAFFWLRFCGAWRLSPWAVAAVAAVYAACFLGDYVDPTLRQFAAWQWDKLAWWAAFTVLTCAGLNSVIDHSAPRKA